MQTGPAAVKSFAKVFLRTRPRGWGGLGSLFLAVLLPNVWACAQPLDAFWLERFEVVARVKVRNIEHSLLSSDVRRVEHGAPIPVVPYKIWLDINDIYPKIKIPRLVFEGIANTVWMPEKDALGIVLLHQEGTKYVPVADFPGNCYFAQNPREGGEVAAFPPGVQESAPADLVWRCLCDLLDSRQHPPAKESLAFWENLAYQDAAPSALIALFYLLHIPQFQIEWNLLTSRMISTHPTAEPSKPALLPFCETTQILAAYVREESVYQVFEILLKTAPHIRAVDAGCLATELISLIERMPPEKQSNALNQLFPVKYSKGTDTPYLIHSFAQVETLFSAGKCAARDDLLAQMVTEPQHFPCIAAREDFESLWNIAANRKIAALYPCLREFIKRPTAEYLHAVLNLQELQTLMQLASRILDSYAPTGEP